MNDNLFKQLLIIWLQLWITSFTPEDVRPAFLDSLKNLELDYLDLYLVNFPAGYKQTVRKVLPNARDKNFGFPVFIKV